MRFLGGRKGRAPLVLSEKDFAANTAALYEELDRDSRAREQFIENPIGDFAEKVLGRVLPRQRQPHANRLLYALLANDAWLDERHVPAAMSQVTERVEALAGDGA